MMPSHKSIPATYSLTRLLLRFWTKFDTGTQYCGEECARIVQVDAARTKYHGIPSIVD